MTVKEEEKVGWVGKVAGGAQERVPERDASTKESLSPTPPVLKQIVSMTPPINPTEVTVC
jgi:hypothetical protein